MIFVQKFAITLLIASISLSCNQTKNEVLPLSINEKTTENTNARPFQFTFNNRLSKYLHGDASGASMYVKNIDFTLHYLSENGINFSDINAVNNNGAIADQIFSSENNIPLVNIGLSTTPITLSQYLVSNTGNWTSSQRVVLESVAQALNANSYENFVLDMERILTSNEFVSLSADESVQVSNFVLVLDYTLQYLSNGIEDIQTNSTYGAKCGGWWSCWGKCTAGILGGVLGGGLGGVLGGSAVPAVGSIVGGVVGAIAGGLSGAAGAC